MESPPFFCAATETSRDVAEVFTKTLLVSLSPHPLEDYILTPDQWPDSTFHDTCTNFLQVLEVDVDNFCSMVQMSNITHLRQISRGILHAIHSVFLPPAITGHAGSDSVSLKKLLEG